MQIQGQAQANNFDLEEKEKMHFRIGINLGDVMVMTEIFLVMLSILPRGWRQSHPLMGYVYLTVFISL